MTPTRNRPKAPLLVALALFVVSVAYFRVFLGYGINLEDEGALLYQFERLADGQRAYVDFHLGYTPGVYYIHSTLQGLFHQSIMPGRVALALANSLSVALLGLLAFPFAGAVGAMTAGVCYLAVAPVHAGFFASFNIPYPTWYSVTVFLAGLLASRRCLAAPSIGRALLAGCLAGVGFLFKPNIGAVQLACAMLLLLSAINWKSSREIFVWWWLVCGAALSGVFGVFGFVARGAELATFLLPVLACALLCARRAAVSGSVFPLRRVASLTGALIAGFVAVNAPWLAYYAASVPVDLLLREVFFVGSDYAQFFYQPHPQALLAVLVFVSAGLAFAAAPTLLKGFVSQPARLLIAGAAAVLLAGSALLSQRPMVEGFYAAIMTEIEWIWIYPLALAVNWLAILACWRLRTTADDAFFAATVGSVFLYLQVYPRTDLMHWVWTASLPVALAVGLAAYARERWSARERRAGRAAVFALCVFPLVFVCALRLGHSLGAVLRWNAHGLEQAPAVRLSSARAPIWMNIGRAERYRDLDRVVEILDQVSKPADRVLAFPALDLVSFLADRHSPIHDTYFFPGWVGHNDEAGVVSKLEDDPPPFVVVHHELRPFFDKAPLYYYQLTDYLAREYRRLAQVGRFAILVNRKREISALASAEIPWKSPDPRLVAYIEASLDASSGAARATALAALSDDLIEGFYPALTQSLEDPDQHVRDAAVSALRNADDRRVARAFLEAVSAERLSPGPKTQALRRAAVWAAQDSVTLLMKMAQDEDMALAETGRNGLDGVATRSLLQSFWPGAPDEATHSAPVFDDSERLRIHSWLREPATDPRLKSFAVGQASAGIGASPEIAQLAAAAQGVEAVTALSTVLSRLVPQPLGRTRLLYELATEGDVPGTSELALDYMAVDDNLAPRAVVAVLRRDPQADRLLAQRALARHMTEPHYTAALLYAGSVTGGCDTLRAALALAAEDLDDEVAAAARRVVHEAARLCPSR